MNIDSIRLIVHPFIELSRGIYQRSEKVISTGMAEGQMNGSGDHSNNHTDFYAGYSRFEIELEVRIVYRMLRNREYKRN